MKNKYRITVSEPWDFKSILGQNLITGKIIQEYSPDFILFKSDVNIRFDDVEGSFILLKPRYVGQNFESIEDGVTVGGSLLSKEGYEGFELKDLEKNSTYVLIGRLEKV